MVGSDPFIRIQVQRIEICWVGRARTALGGRKTVCKTGKDDPTMGFKLLLKGNLAIYEEVTRLGMVWGRGVPTGSNTHEHKIKAERRSQSMSQSHYNMKNVNVSLIKCTTCPQNMTAGNKAIVV